MFMRAQAQGAIELAKPLQCGVRLMRLDQAVSPGEVSLDRVDRIPDLRDYGREVACHPDTCRNRRALFLELAFALTRLRASPGGFLSAFRLLPTVSNHEPSRMTLAVDRRGLVLLRQ
jgi:hypothetical protein